MAVFRGFKRILLGALFALSATFVSTASRATSCPSGQVLVDGVCYNGKFAVKTTDAADTTTFQFEMSAAGTFTVDCGTGGNLTSSYSGQIGADGKTITRGTRLTEDTYTCTYSNAGSHVITFDGSADGYSTGSSTAAIRFVINGSRNNAQKIASIYGSLGAIFGTKTNPSVGQSQPRFHSTFFGASNMTGSIPTNLFAGISGSPTTYMFGYTFYGCSGLTGPIPSGLFGNLTGSPANNMFEGTFSGCSGLTGSIPSGLFGSLTGSPAPYMFDSTFYGCSGLTGSIPSGLFGNLTGSPAPYMFESTFSGCSNLSGSIPSGLFGNLTGSPAERMFEDTFSDCSGLTGSIPSGLFGNLTGSPANYMFTGTFFHCSGLTGPIPSGLFGNLTGSPANCMFLNTFSGCSSLTGSIPSGLFGNLTGSPANYMFANTFYGCSGLTGFTDGTTTTSYVPATFLNTIDTNTSVSSQATDMFSGTGLADPCPANTYAVTRAQFNDAGKPWCSASAYTITYACGNGATGNPPANGTATYNANFTPAANNTCAKTGYTFAGWNDGTADRPAGTAFTWTYTGNKTFTAKWTPDVYTVTLDSNGGTIPSGGTTSVSATYGAGMPSPITNPIRTGYDFTGYYDATSGGTKYYNADGTSARNWDKTEDTTLYAQWKRKQYVIYLDKTGETNPSACNDDILYGTYGDIDVYIRPSRMIGLGLYPTSDSHNSICLPERTDWVPLGYYDSQVGGSKCIGTDGQLTSEGSQIARTYETDQTWYIHWGKQCAAGTYFRASDATCAPCPNGSYCSGGAFEEFGGDQGISACPDGSTGSDNGRDAITDCFYVCPDTITVEHASNVAPVNAKIYLTKKSYNVYTYSNCTYNVVCDSGYYPSAQNVSSPVCSGVIYTVTLDANGGSGGTTSVSATYNSPMTTLKALPSRSKYGFTGYYDATSGGTKYYNADGTSARNWDKTENTTLYAQWDNTALITLDPNGGTIPEGGTTSVVATYNVGMPSINTAKLPTRAAPSSDTNYRFHGYWDSPTYLAGTRYYTAEGASARTWDKETIAQTLYAQWKPEYIITLDPNGGVIPEGGMTEVFASQSSGTYNQSNVTIPVLTGHTFTGYYDAQTGGKRYFNARGNISLMWDKTSGATLYAQWTPSTYTVTYACGTGATGAPANGTATYNADFTPANNTCSKTGYAFAGWNDGTTDRPAGTAFTWTYTSDKTFTAQWTAQTSNVTLDANNGTMPSGATTSVTATYDEEMPEIDTTKLPTLTGYTFSGYYESTRNGTQYYTADGVSARTWNKTGTRTLYAHWTRGVYTVTLDDATNGGSGGMGTIKEVYDQKWTDIDGNTITSVTIPSRPNGVFLGYYDSDDNQRIAYNGSILSFSSPKQISADTTWYAKFGNCACSTHYTVSSCESIESDDPNRCKYTYTCNDYYHTENGEQSGTFYGNVTVQQNSVPACIPNEYTITLDNANATTNGTDTLYTKYNTGVYLDSARTTSAVTNPITKPQRSGYATVSYDANGGSISTNLGDSYTKSNYIFDGYYSDITGGTRYINEDGQVISDGRSAGILYTSNDNVWHAQWKSSRVTTPSATRTGYRFDGWYDAQNGGNCVSRCTLGVNAYTPTADITLYAHWSPLAYKVTMNDNAANTAAGISEFWYRYNESDNPCTYYTADASLDSNRISANCVSTPITLPTRTGYTFNGYKSSSTGGTQYIDASGNILDTVYTTTGDKTAIANWTVNKYTVETDLNDGSAIATTNVTYNNSFSKYNPARNGYTFAGWNITSMDDTEHTIGSSTTNETSVSGIMETSFKNLRATSGTVRFTAQWTPITYTITYKTYSYGEEITGLTPTTYTTGSTINLPTNVNVADHVFSGSWYDGSGNEINQITPEMYGDKVLYAKWTSITCPAGYYVSARNNNDGNKCEECYGSYYCPGDTFTISDVEQGKIECPTTTNVQEGAYITSGGASGTIEGLSGDPNVADTAEDCVAVLVYGRNSTLALFSGGDTTQMSSNYNPDLDANIGNALSSLTCAYNSTADAYTNCFPFMPRDSGIGAEIYCYKGYYIPQSDIDYMLQVNNAVSQCASLQDDTAKTLCQQNIVQSITSRMGAPYACTLGEAGYYTTTYDDVMANNDIGATEKELYSNIGVIYSDGVMWNTSTMAETTNVSDVYKSCSVETNGAYPHSQPGSWTKKQCYATISFDTNGGNAIDDINYYYNGNDNMCTTLSETIDETDATWVMYKLKRLNGLSCYAASVSGDDAQINTLSEDCNDEVFDGLSNGDWSTEWSYGVVTGKSLCSATSGSSLSSGNPSNESGGNCWCKINSFIDGDNNVFTSSTNTWVFMEYTTDSCLSNCASSCAVSILVNPNARTAMYNNACMADGFPTPTREGYAFDGWYANSGLTGNRLENSDDLPGGDKTLYAKWISDAHNIVYNQNGGNGCTNATYVGTTTLCEPTRDGYTFDGWATEENGAVVYGTNSSVTNLDLTLYAIWTPNTCNITFDKNTNDTVTYMPSVNPKNCTYNDICHVYGERDSDNNRLLLPTRTGYVFVEWNTEQNGGGDGFVYRLRYGGNPARSADLSGVFDLSGEPENVTLYAQWTPISYTITYNNMDDATNYDNAPTSYTVESETITLGAPTKNGYMFGGWFAESTFDTRITEIQNGSTGDVILYAKWSFGGCGAGNYYDNDLCVSCATATDGEYPLSANNATSVNQCYRFCTTNDINNSTAITGNAYYGEVMDTCSATSCATGYNPKTLNDIIWDTDATEYVYVDNNGVVGSSANATGDETTYYLNDNEFAMNFGDRGIVRGIGRCSTTSGDNGNGFYHDPTILNYVPADFNNGTSCWCRVKDYKASNDNDYQTLSSAWMFLDNYSDVSSCSDECAKDCAQIIGIPQVFSQALRGAVFGDAVYDGGNLCELRHVTITFNENTNDTVDYMPSENPKNCLYGEDCKIMGALVGANVGRLPARTGYKFVEWNTQSNGTGSGFVYVNRTPRRPEVDLSGLFDITDEDTVTLYAQWQLADYDIIYNNMDDATNYDDAPTSYTFGTGATIDGIPTRDGYFFDGWCTDEELENCAYTQTIGTDATGDKEFWAKWEPAKFTLTTTEMTANDTFTWSMSASGTFYVDCGDDGVLSSTANDVTNGNTITRSNTTAAQYTCTYPTGGTHTIKFGGAANGYNATDGSSSSYAAIGFSTPNYSNNTPAKIAGISGSLGEIFGTIGNGDTLATQPRFMSTFYNAINMAGSIPSNLFTGITGAPASSMFSSTFRDCSGLTGTIPSTLFCQDTENPNANNCIYGAPADSMFSGTFYNCSKLSGQIPATLFAGIHGAPASYMFVTTFYNCSGLTGTIPSTLFCQDTNNPNANNCIYGAPAQFMFSTTFSGCSKLSGQIPATLFAGIHGAPAQLMFAGTFSDCSGLNGFTDGTTTTSYVPATFLNTIDTNTSVSNQAINMFNGTGLASSCPANTYNVTREQFNNAVKPWCTPCPDGTTSPAGSTSIDQCVVPSYNITYMDGGVELTGLTPATYNAGVGATINAQPTKAHGTFAGWCTDAGLTNCALPQTIAATDTGDKTYYAKFTCDTGYTFNPGSVASKIGNVDGASYAYIDNSGSFNEYGANQGQNSYGITDNSAFAVKYLNGAKIKGHAACNYVDNTSNVATWGQDWSSNWTPSVYNIIDSNFIDSLPESNHTKSICYCRLEEYTNGTEQQSLSSPWVFYANYNNFGGNTHCNGTCSKDCAEAMYNNGVNGFMAFRSAMLNAVSASLASASSCDINSYTITFNLNGGTNYDNAPTSYTYGVGATIDGVPTRDGYTFAGWTGSNGSTPQTNVTIGTTDTGNKSYTANWTAKTYTVTLNANGGTGGTTTIYKKYDDGYYSDSDATTTITQITIPTRDNYDFIGYYTSGNALRVIDENGNIIAPVNTFTSDTTLYAVWEETFDPNNPPPADPTPDTPSNNWCPRYEDTPDYQNVHYGAITCTGHSSGGAYNYYYYSPAGRDNKLAGCQLFYTVPNTSIPNVNTNISGYTKTMFRSLYNPETGNYEGGTQIQYSGVPSTVALHCASGYSNKSANKGMIYYNTLYGENGAILNACTANTTGGFTEPDDPTEHHCPDAFPEYPSDITSTDQCYKTCTTPVVGCPDHTDTCAYATADSNNKDYYVEGKTACAITFTCAHGYLPNNEHTECIPRPLGITFDKNTNDEVRYMPSENPKNCTYGEDCNVSAIFVVNPKGHRKPARQGYSFKDWDTMPDGTGNRFEYYVAGVAGNQVMYVNLSGLFDLPNGPENVTLYAQWTPISYTITYNNMDGATNYDNAPTNYTVESETITLGAPTKNGYMFGGWFAESTFDTRITEIQNGSTGDVTLYAKWIESCANEVYPAYDGNAYTCDDSYKFWIETTEDTERFVFELIAAGEFVVNWGDGNVETISRPSAATSYVYSHDYNVPGSYNIGFKSINVTAYPTDDTTTITFGCRWWRDDCNTTNEAVRRIHGTFGQFLPLLENSADLTKRPRFGATFAQCYNLEGSIPANLFAGSVGTVPVHAMFAGTFAKCSKLSGQIPTGLFGTPTGQYATYAFENTFLDDPMLTGSIPAGLFGTMYGTPQNHMFMGTFEGCSGLTGKIPTNLFGTPSGTLTADRPFKSAFDGCSGLDGFVDSSTGTTYDYIPQSFFGNLDDTGYTTGPMANIFAGTDIAETCPDNMYVSDTAFRVDFNAVADTSTGGYKVMCVPCPNGYVSVSGENSTINQCYTTCPANDSLGGTYVPELGGHAYYGVDGDNISTCTYAYTITYNLNGGTNYDNAPTGYTFGTGATIDGVPTRDGYIFAGWCTDAELENCAYTQTIGTDATGNKEFWAKWEPVKFSVTTRPMVANDTFKFNMTAAGTFYIDCGDDGVLSSTANDFVGKVITRNNTTNATYTCTYENAGTHVIKFGGLTEYYSDLSWIDANLVNTPAIRFGTGFDGNTTDATPEKIASISGSLGAIFPTKDNGSSYYRYQPRFANTFAGATYLTALPVDANNKSTLFSGIYGAGANEGFWRTFAQSGLTSLPSGLFADITGTAALFDKTFIDCSDLTSLPGDLFPDLDGAYTAMFLQTFYDAGLTSIPGTLFDGVYGNADRLFANTFAGCSALTSLPTDANGNSLLFKNISGSNTSMFQATFTGAGLTSLPKKLFNVSGATVQDKMFIYTFERTPLTSLPDDLFAGLTGSAPEAFYHTFYETSNLTTIRSDLFAGLSGGAASMFGGTFGSSGVNSVYNVNTGITTNYIPGSFLNNITTSASGLVTGMFSGSGFGVNCPVGTYKVTPQIFSAAGKPWCDPCPNGYTSVSGSNNTINQCYTTCPLNDSLGGTYVSELGGHAYYGVDGDDISTCKYAYTITYHDGEDIVELSPSTYTYTVGATIDAVLTREGYTFGGWYDNSELTGDAITAIPTDAIGNIDLYAKWDANTYTVILDKNANDAMPGTTSVTVTYGADMPTINAPERNGYDFIGYYDTQESTDGTKYYDPVYRGALVRATSAHVWDKTSGATLYAHWTPRSGEIKLKHNDGTDDVEPIYTIFDTGVYKDSDHTLEMTTVANPVTPLTRSGFTFDGYVQYVSYSTIIEPGNSGNMQDFYVATPEDLARPRLIDASGYITADGLALGKTVYEPRNPAINLASVWKAVWIPIEYNIQYVLCPDGSANCIANASNDSRNPTTYNTTQNVTLYDASRNGYDFAGWYDNPELTSNVITTIPQNSIGQKTFYASWTPKQYTISYRCFDNGDVVHADSLMYGDSYNFVSNTDDHRICQRPGWIFAGWTCSYVDENSESHNISTDPVSKWYWAYDVSCVPSPWDETYFSVSFNANSMYVENPEAMSSISCPYSTGCALPESLYVRNGYLFNGWKSNEDEVYNIGDTIKEQLSDVTMYAQWKPQDNIQCVAGTYLKAGDFDKCTNCPVGFYCPGFESGEYVYSATKDQGIRSCRVDFGSTIPSVTTDSKCEDSEEIGGCAKSLSDCYVPCDTTYGNYVIDSENNKIRYGQIASDVCLYKADIEYKGAENCDTQTYLFADRTSVPLCVPNEVLGRTFIGWTDNKGNKYTDISADNNEHQIDDNVPESGVVTMTANWDIEQYIISYDCGNGNNIVVGDMEYDDDVELLDYARCDNPGYTLTKWNCGDDFADNNKMPNHDVECVAETTVNTYNIEFNGNGADSGNMDTIENISYIAEQQLSENTYERSGYDFVGWCDNNTCSDHVYDDKEIVSKLTPDNDATVVLYAKWEAIPYTISYTIPYGITVANKTTYTKETPTFTLNNPSKPGYKFNAWCTNAELTENCELTKTIEQGSTIGNLAFFASMEPIEYTITYKFKDVDGVVHDISDMFADRYTKRIVGQSVSYPKKADVHIPNYNFVAWYNNSNLTGASVNGVAASVTSNMTAWAKVTTLSCGVNQYIEEGVCKDCPAHSSSDGALTTECVCDTGYYKNAENCVPNTITLDWNENGGSQIDNGVCDYDADLVLPDAPVRNGYVFAGWKLADGTIKNATETVAAGCVGNYIGVTSDVSTAIVAQWNVQKYTIKYNSNGGTKYSQKQYTVNSADIILPQNAVRNGYEFGGWYTNEDLSGSVVDMVAHGSTGNKEFWAKWNVINYEISYNNDGGEFKSGYVPTTTYNISSDTIALPTSDDIVRDNYVFVGWVDKNNNIVTEIQSGSSGNKELTAQWTHELCEQNQFWNTSSDMCDACPAHSTSAGGLATQCNCDNHYVMNNNTCVPKSYTITYYYNGGTLAEGLTNPQTYNIEMPETVLYVPEKTDYTFNGWHLNSVNGAIITNISGDMIAYKNIRLYATWTKNPDTRTITYNCKTDKTIERAGFVGSNVTVPTTEECEISTGDITGWTCNGQTYTDTMIIQSNNITCTPVISYANVEYNIIYKGYDTDGNEIDLSFLGPTTYTASNGIRLPTKNQINIPGYNFERWYLKYNNSVFSSSITGYAANANIRGAKTFYAKFTAVTVHCDPGYYLPANSTECALCEESGMYCPGGDFVYSDTIDSINTCDENYPLSDSGAQSIDDCYKLCDEREHYTVVGHQYSDGTNDCVYTPVTYYIYYNTNGGNTVAPTEYNVEMGVITELPIPEKDDKDFDGWFDVNGTQITGIDTSLGTDITLYAHWKYKACDGNQYRLDGLCTACPANSHAAEDGVSECLCDSGYIKEADNCQLVEYYITYVGLEGTTHSNPLTYTVEDSDLQFSAPSDRIGYEFTGWTKDGEVFTTIPSGMLGDITLTANWKAKTIHCDPGYYYPGNSETCTQCVEENIYCPGGDYTYSDTPNGKENCPVEYPYSTDGISCYNSCVDPNVSGAIYADGRDTCDYTYPIEYNLDGGEFNTVYPETYEHGVGILPLATPVKHGYGFYGWYDNPEKQGNPVTNIDTNRYGAVELWAKWGFVCESGKWLHLGDGDDRLCLYTEKPAGTVMVLETRDKPTYIMLTEDEDVTVHKGSSKKLRVAIGDKVYNAYDASVNMD